MLESGDRREEFRRLYRAFYQPVSAYARRRLDPHDADDAVAEIFLVAWRRLADVPEGESALPWLYGVARRVVSEDRRSGRRRDRLIVRLSTIQPAADEALHEAMDRVDDQLLPLMGGGISEEDRMAEINYRALQAGYRNRSTEERTISCSRRATGRQKIQPASHKKEVQDGEGAEGWSESNDHVPGPIVPRIDCDWNGHRHRAFGSSENRGAWGARGIGRDRGRCSGVSGNYGDYRIRKRRAH